jgi:hypothetical protein
MVLENWLAGWAVLLAFAAMYFIRTPREERLMTETFGEAYRQYSVQTGRVFPRLMKAAEQTHTPEPADGPVSNGESSSPTQ